MTFSSVMNVVREFGLCGTGMAVSGVSIVLRNLHLVPHIGRFTEAGQFQKLSVE